MNTFSVLVKGIGEFSMNEDSLNMFSDRCNTVVYQYSILQKEHSLSFVEFLMPAKKKKKKIWRFRLEQLSEE